MALTLAVTIDRPKGFKKTFQTQNGPKEMEYPLDYGYFNDFINSEDGEHADVFLGSGGLLYGCFMKGSSHDGVWRPDEHKWYAGPHTGRVRCGWWLLVGTT